MKFRGNAKQGFTLMEVMVALAVLAAGTVAFENFFDSFNNIRILERRQAKAFVEAASVMENLIENPPLCRDSVYVQNQVRVRLEAAPGVIPLVLVQVAHDSCLHKIELQRLVKCKR